MAHRRHEEGKPPTDRREVSSGLPINSAVQFLTPDMPNMCLAFLFKAPFCGSA